jgi:DNA-binding IclR family transcriptional regulator
MASVVSGPALYARIGDNVALTTLDGESALAIDWILAEPSAYLLGRTGTRIPPRDRRRPCAVGPRPGGSAAKGPGRPTDRFTFETLVEPDDLRHALSDIRRRGYVVSCRQFTDR